MSTINRSQGEALTRPDGTPIRILAVDDEQSLTELLSMAMRYEGWEVSTAGSGLTAVQVARDVRPDAIVLDMMLPDFDGLEVMRRIRAEQPDVPVIFLTAKDAVDDRVGGLTAGGDDYVTKPFSLEELIARLRGLLRRSGATTVRPGSQLVVGDLILDEDSHEVTPVPYTHLDVYKRQARGHPRQRPRVLHHGHPDRRRDRQAAGLRHH